MSRFHTGIIQGAHSPTGGGLPPLDPGNFESDWTASLVAPPTGWTNVTDDGESYVYTATGAYSGDNDDTLAGAWLHTVSRDVSAMTLMLGYTVNAFDNVVTNVQLNDGVDGIRGDLSYHQTGDDGFVSMSLDMLSGWPGSFDPLTNTDPTGLVILAGTFFQSGLRKFYRFDGNGAVTVGSNSGAAPTVHSLTNSAVVMQNYDFSNSIPGVPGSYRVHHTYFGYDEELDLAAITAIATGWGWT